MANNFGVYLNECVLSHGALNGKYKGVYGSLIKYHRKNGYRGQDRNRNSFRTSVGVAVDRHNKNKKFQTKNLTEWLKIGLRTKKLG